MMRRKLSGPSTTQERAWKWKIIWQWRTSRPSTLVQLISFTVGLVILVWLWMPPNDGVMTMVMQGLVTIIYGWAVLVLFGPYRSNLQEGSNQ